MRTSKKFKLHKVTTRTPTGPMVPVLSKPKDQPAAFLTDHVAFVNDGEYGPSLIATNNASFVMVPVEGAGRLRKRKLFPAKRFAKSPVQGAGKLFHLDAGNGIDGPFPELPGRYLPDYGSNPHRISLNVNFLKNLADAMGAERLTLAFDPPLQRGEVTSPLLVKPFDVKPEDGIRIDGRDPVGVLLPCTEVFKPEPEA